MSAKPGLSFGSGLDVAFSFPFSKRKESTVLSSSFSYPCGIAILPAEPSGQGPLFSQLDRTLPRAAPAGDRGQCSHLPGALLVRSALPSGLRSERSSGWPTPHPAPSSLAIPEVFQNPIDVCDGFVQVFDHPIGCMIWRLR